MFRRDKASPFLRVQDRRAEHDQRGAGLSAAGKVPFVLDVREVRDARTTRSRWRSTQARTSRSSAATRGSASPATASQMSLPDIAWFRSFATMRPPQEPGASCNRPTRTPRTADGRDGGVRGRAATCGRCVPRRNSCTAMTRSSTSAGSRADRRPRRDAAGGERTWARWGTRRWTCWTGGHRATLVDAYSIPFDNEDARPGERQRRVRDQPWRTTTAAGWARRLADAFTQSGDSFTLEQMCDEAESPKTQTTPGRCCG